jgi:hypothetical protein
MRWYIAHLTTGCREEWPRMLNFQRLVLLHHHGGGEYEPMTEHGVDTHDPERALLRGELRGARIFRCSKCADEVLVMPPTDPTGEVTDESA